MKKLLLLIVGCLFLVSCRNSTADAMQELEKQYDNAEIYRVDHGEYVMLDSTGVYFIQNIGFTKPKFAKILVKKGNFLK